MCWRRSSSRGTSWAVGAKVIEVTFYQLLAVHPRMRSWVFLLICIGEKCVGPGDGAPSRPIGVVCIWNVGVYCLFAQQRQPQQRVQLNCGEGYRCEGYVQSERWEAVRLLLQTGGVVLVRAWT